MGYRRQSNYSSELEKAVQDYESFWSKYCSSFVLDLDSQGRISYGSTVPSHNYKEVIINTSLFKDDDFTLF